MFTSRHVKMEVSKASLKTGTNERNEITREAEISLAMEPFPMELARELGEDIAGHLFTDDNAVRGELEGITLNPRVQPQAIEVYADWRGEVLTHTLRHVRFGSIRVTRCRNERSGDEWLKAVVNVSLDLTVRDHREWLVGRFGEHVYLSFDPEQTDMLADIVGPVMNPAPGVTLTSAALIPRAE